MSGPDKNLAVDGVSMAVTNAHTMAQNDVENNIDINELKRRIERRDAENKRKDREVILLQREILNLTKETQDLRDRNEQLQQSLTNARLLTSASRQDEENKFTSTVITDLQMKLDRTEHALNDALGDHEVAKATVVTLKDQLIETLATSEVRAKEIQSLKEDYYSLNIKLKTLQIRLQEKDTEYERLQTINEAFLKSERQLKGQLEHEKTLSYEHERTINELLATNKRMMASNLIKSETNQFLTSELSGMRDGSGTGGGEGGGILTSTEFEALKEIEKKNVTLTERNKELTKSIELHMDLLQRCEAENSVLKLKVTEETDLREELQHEMKNYSENQTGKENTFQQLKREVVKLRKENKILAEKCDELMRQPPGSRAQGQGGGGGGGRGGGGGDEDSLSIRIRSGGPSADSHPHNREERKRLKLSEETVKALRNRISFLLEQLTQLSTQSSAWNEQKLIFKSQISSLLEANISLRERLLTVQRSFMERSLYELDHPAVRRNAKPIFLTEGEEERVMTTGQWKGQVEDDGEGDQHQQQFNSPEAILEGAIVSHSLAPVPLKGLSQDPNVREARLLEYSMRSELGQPLPYTIEGFIERTMFDTLCAFTSGGRSSSSDQSSSKGKQLMKPKASSAPPLHSLTRCSSCRSRSITSPP
jgi:DNA repair exonuclease SbcCD ATPase subunit